MYNFYIGATAGIVIAVIVLALVEIIHKRKTIQSRNSLILRLSSLNSEKSKEIAKLKRYLSQPNSSIVYAKARQHGLSHLYPTPTLNDVLTDLFNNPPRSVYYARTEIFQLIGSNYREYKTWIFYLHPSNTIGMINSSGIDTLAVFCRDDWNAKDWHRMTMHGGQDV